MSFSQSGAARGEFARDQPIAWHERRANRLSISTS